MELSGISQFSSSIYMQIAQKRAELDSIDKKELQKSTQESYDNANETSNNYDEADYNRVIDKFKKTDTETKAHEQEHASNATTTTPISYNYQVGPDGKLYAVGGSVRYDTSMPEDEASASVKLEQLQSAASAPSDLSVADSQVAISANLNKMLLLSKQAEQEGVTNDN